jgi:hypothetical protein
MIASLPPDSIFTNSTDALLETENSERLRATHYPAATGLTFRVHEPTSARLQHLSPTRRDFADDVRAL